ncbi:cytochrome oxidase assembly protein ShyY1 [Terracoccus luteus]|uniref:SURF1-like protein n=1 Tax=Terracoccus luteus TaxID=53356 RepID=A0A495XZE7_9MICO|nr:SURF1 family protein [Terracoccus luteus]RKT78096.1 cytochrome oxidase assembly protein ShyY1 [Terracoccus luteus]
MLRLWLTRRWIVATLVAVTFGVACYHLGLWQWHRHVEQQTKVTAIATNYDSAPRPLSDLAGRLADLPAERQWTRVTLTGTYAEGSDLLVRNRTLDDNPGFEVVTPFTTDGRTLLVDRGWVPSGEDAAVTPVADPPPSGSVEVTGWVRTAEPSLGRDLPAPQLASVSVQDARRLVPGLDTADVYVVLGSQQPPAAVGSHPLQLLPRPTEDLGPHQAYAYQWWLFMPGGLVFVVLALRREAAAAAEPGDPASGDVGPTDDGGLGPTGDQTGDGRRTPVAAGATPRTRPAKPKKVRIWDEEDG